MLAEDVKSDQVGPPLFLLSTLDLLSTTTHPFNSRLLLALTPLLSREVNLTVTIPAITQPMPPSVALISLRDSAPCRRAPQITTSTTTHMRSAAAAHPSPSASCVPPAPTLPLCIFTARSPRPRCPRANRSFHTASLAMLLRIPAARARSDSRRLLLLAPEPVSFMITYTLSGTSESVLAPPTPPSAPFSSSTSHCSSPHSLRPSRAIPSSLRRVPKPTHRRLSDSMSWYPDERSGRGVVVRLPERGVKEGGSSRVVCRVRFHCLSPALLPPSPGLSYCLHIPCSPRPWFSLSFCCAILISCAAVPRSKCNVKRLESFPAYREYSSAENPSVRVFPLYTTASHGMEACTVRGVWTEAAMSAYTGIGEYSAPLPHLILPRTAAVPVYYNLLPSASSHSALYPCPPC
ncbi:hypothetical protein B0H13DRAFT_2318137 [Mycena leptocephala]|nr:hypothetical protein B0H13DRAFT_2318137 [Mycena leptocephala]